MKNKFSFKLTVLIASCLFFSFSVFSQSATSFYERGISAQEREDWYAASQFFIEATKINPSYADAWYRLAESTYYLGQYELVLSYLDVVEKFQRSNTAVQNLRGLTFIALGRTGEARDSFQSVLSRSPNDIDARFGLAELDLINGKVSGAEQFYKDALSRQGTNRKALLSLALVSSELGKIEQSQNYMNLALRYYSGETEVHYLAAWLAVMKGDYVEAERQCRAALDINDRYDNAYAMLASVSYAQKKYSQAIDICDIRIGDDRNRSDAWYLKGMCLYKTGDVEGAIGTWTTGLTIEPNDEIMRSALEVAINENLPLEDRRRGGWASFHITAAKEYARRYDAGGQNYEYQRALKVDPNNNEARQAYADILDLNGFHELYLEQMMFLRNASSSANLKRSDTIEGYASLLGNSLGRRWHVEPFYLDKVRWRIGIYYSTTDLQFFHAGANEVTAKMAADIFSGAAVTSVSVETNPITGFGDAYKRARDSGLDYFIIISTDEGSRDVVVNSVIYSARTGTEVTRDSFYAAGNNRYSTVLRRFRESVLSCLAVRGKIIDRNGTSVLVDLGRAENIANGAVFDVVRRGAISVSDNGRGVFYREEDILGKIEITETGEEISEGNLTLAGFYDRVSTNDEIVLLSLPVLQNEKASLAVEVAGSSPQTSANGDTVTVERKKIITASDFRAKHTPIYVDLIRGIR